MLNQSSNIPPYRGGSSAGAEADSPEPPNIRRVQVAFNELKPAYRMWLGQQLELDPEAAIGVVGFVLNNCAIRDEWISVTAPSVDTLGWVLDFIDEFFPETIEIAVSTMLGFLEFLVESENFTGDSQLLEDLYILLVEGETTSDDLPERENAAEPQSNAPHSEAPALSVAKPQQETSSVDLATTTRLRETLAALEWLPLTIRARAFLGWIGNGKKITEGGMLRRDDIRDAAETLGENALGVSKDPSTGSWIPGGSAIWKVRSMGDAPSLDLYWQMLRYAGLIECSMVQVTHRKSEYRVFATQAGVAFRERDPRATIEAVLGMATVGYKVLTGVLPRSNGTTHADGESVAQVLSAGSTSAPMPTHLVAVAPTGFSEVTLDMATGKTYPRLGERIYHWGNQGLVDLEDTLTIPEVLLPALTKALAEIHGPDVEAPAEPG